MPSLYCNPSVSVGARSLDRPLGLSEVLGLDEGSSRPLNYIDRVLWLDVVGFV